MRVFTVKAPAKINLQLEVCRPARPDGFHEVRSIMQAIALADLVEVGVIGSPGVGLTCSDPSVPCDETNLAARAAFLFLSLPEIDPVGVAIHIEKKIPVGAGLGGGSADAAATLVGLRGLIAPEMPDGQLESLAADLGSDVPFFIQGGTQVALGRGEVIAPATHPLGEVPMVLAMPGRGCSTPEIYSRYDRGQGDGDDAPGLHDALPALGEGNLAGVVGNDLRPAAIAAVPEIGQVLKALQEQGLTPVEMSGSGSACFGMAESREHAVNSARALSDEFPFVQACMTWTGGCEVAREQ